MKEKPRYKLSPSSLSLLEECPRCFWLQLVKKIRRPGGAFPTLPSGVDNRLKEHFDRFRERGELPPELRKERIDASLFNDIKLLEIWRNNRKGIGYMDEETGIYLYGAIDELLVKGKKFIIMDFKTRGYDLKENTAHMYQDKMNVYNLIFRRNGYETEDYSYLLFYVPERIEETGELVFKTELVKMNINVKHAENLFKSAVRVLEEEEPVAGEECGYCRFGRLG